MILSALEIQSTPIGYQHFTLFFYYIRFKQNQEQKFKLFLSLVEFALDIVASCFCHLRGCNLFQMIGFKHFWGIREILFSLLLYWYFTLGILLNQVLVFGIFIQGITIIIVGVLDKTTWLAHIIIGQFRNFHKRSKISTSSRTK